MEWTTLHPCLSQLAVSRRGILNTEAFGVYARVGGRREFPRIRCDQHK
jgi:hypothetical protein